MEAKLKTLVEANSPDNRSRWAHQWKEKGNVIGIIGPNIPEEIMLAAGMLPWGVSGTWDAATPLARVHRPEMTSVYCTHVLEAVMKGDLDFLNGIITTQWDDDFKHLWYVIQHTRRYPFNYIMYLPHTKNKITFQGWKKSVLDLKRAIEELDNHVIKDEAIASAIEVCNKTRTLLKKLYEMRKKEIPPVTGAEALGITTAARVMPKNLFNSILEELLPYLESRKAPFKETRPRILVSSDFLQHPGYIELIESAGCAVVMDEMDTGSRYFWNNVDETIQDPWEALARRYIDVASPRMDNWDEQIGQMIEWGKEYNVDGIIELRQLYSFPREFRFTYSNDLIKEAKMPHMFLRIEYHLAGTGMLRTRIEAFLEMIKNR